MKKLDGGAGKSSPFVLACPGVSAVLKIVVAASTSVKGGASAETHVMGWTETSVTKFLLIVAGTKADA